jgi:hypothetical protein
MVLHVLLLMSPLITGGEILFPHFPYFYPFPFLFLQHEIQKKYRNLDLQVLCFWLSDLSFFCVTVYSCCIYVFLVLIS